MLRYLPLLALVCHVRAQLPEATNYLGVGYNILTGNPEGELGFGGGVDPGLKLTRPVFLITYLNDGVNPDQGETFLPGPCNVTQYSDTLEGTLRYQNTLDQYVVTSAPSGIDGYSYAQSSGYDYIKQTNNDQGLVTYDERQETYCGYTRIRTEDASVEEFPLTDSFASAICGLPNTYEEEVYMNFLDDWGTHVVTQLSYGSRITKRYMDETPVFVSYSLTECPGCVSQGGPYNAYNNSLVVDMDMFVSNMDANTKFGDEKGVFETGGDGAMTEPMELVVMPISDALGIDYWRKFCDYVSTSLCVLEDLADLTVRQGHIDTALSNYASYKSVVMPSNPAVQTPITWPADSYGLPTPVDGCPNSVGFAFESGFRFQDNEDGGTGNAWSTPYDLEGPYTLTSSQQNFCMKTVPTVSTDDWVWTPGEYCIYKKGACPASFAEGFVFWDDEDTDPQDNSLGGTLPDGTYDRNTEIKYCCREDGLSTDPIYLPTDVPFVLVKRTANCQAVVGMTATDEWFLSDNENTLNQDDVGGFGPYNTGGFAQHQLHYCYYT